VFGKRILILAAHPDDEVVACAAAIGRARQKGAEIFVFYLTNGCIARTALWPWQRKHYVAKVLRRFAEAEQTARLLNVAPAGWSSRPARHLWRNLQAVFDEVKQTIATHGIDQIWVPAFEGGHADHDALNAVGKKLSAQVKVLEFAEYNFANGKNNSHEFLDPNGTEQTILLTREEQKKKHEALKTYASEQQNLNYVKVERECYRPLNAYDYTKPPHKGKLWYARFQWVPFRHPRVDFSKPENVSKEIASFLAKDV